MHTFITVLHTISEKNEKNVFDQSDIQRFIFASQQNYLKRLNVTTHAKIYLSNLTSNCQQVFSHVTCEKRLFNLRD